MQTEANNHTPGAESGAIADADVFDQDCADYLRFLGFEDAKDGIGMNAPYRPDADSQSFYTHGPLWYDHSHGEGGNVWQLALRMNANNREAALRSFYDCAGLPYRPDSPPNRAVNQRQAAEQALAIVKEKFALSEQTPQEVRAYLASRGITTKSWPWLAYVPAGKLATVLTPEQIELTGLGQREDKLILWYFHHGQPVYYCTRSIAEKEFKKAPVAHLQHPIWNADALYKAKEVVWAEGFFDCLSLIELGIEVCGEITCNPVKAHLDELMTALRWRQKHMPDARFTICLDSDALTKEGHRPGNEAAAKLAVRLFSAGLDQWWVKHDVGAEKVDLNDLHRTGRDSEIHRMLASAKRFSEIVPASPDMVKDAFFQAMAEGDARTASALVDKYVTLKPKDTAARTMQALLGARIPYQELYRGIRLYLYGGDVYVLHDRRRYAQGAEQYDSFGREVLIENIRGFQQNRNMELSLKHLDIPAGRPYYRVTRNPAEATRSEFNLFRPAPLLLQTPVLGGVPIPSQFKLILDNIAGRAEQEWLLNHMATYLQTMEKLRTIPVLVGHQGSGKNTLFEMLGRGVGGYMPIDKDLIESPFNQYLLHPVILLDELVSSNADAKSIKSKLKSFINEEQTIHPKNQKPYTVRLNNYIAVSSNESVTNVPVIIEQGDRRYTVITGGKDLDLAKVQEFDREELERQLPDFMLCLLSRKTDAKAANIPLDNAARRDLMEQGEDPRIAIVREWAEEHHGQPNESLPLSGIKGCLTSSKELRQPLTTPMLRNILENLGYVVKERNHQPHCYGLTGQPKGLPPVSTDGTDQDPYPAPAFSVEETPSRPSAPAAAGAPGHDLPSKLTATSGSKCGDGGFQGLLRGFSGGLTKP